MAPGGRNKIVRQRRAPRESLEFVPPAKQRCLRSANEKHSEVTSPTINRLVCYQKKRKTRSLATEKQAPHLENICLSAQGVVIGSRLSGIGNEWKFKALPEKKELRLCCRDLPQQDMMAEQENEIPPVGSVMDPGRAQHLDKSDSTSDETMSRLHLSDVDPEVEIDELCKELSKEHKDMMQVLFSRKLKLEAALTFWKRHPEDLVSYLFRVHDLCVVADCVGIVTKSFIESDELLSLGACVDLLPLIHALLKSRYANHNLTALDWLTVVIKHWWATLANDDHQNELHFSASNVSTMRDWLQKMMDQVRKLSVIPGPTGKRAKVCHLAFQQLHSQWAGVKHQ